MSGGEVILCFYTEADDEPFEQRYWPAVPRRGEIVDFGFDENGVDRWFRVLQVAWKDVETQLGTVTNKVYAEILVEPTGVKLVRPTD